MPREKTNLKNKAIVLFVLSSLCLAITGFIRSSIYEDSLELDIKCIQAVSETAKDNVIRLEGRVKDHPKMIYGELCLQLEPYKVSRLDSSGELDLGSQAIIELRYDGGSPKILRDDCLAIEGMPVKSGEYSMTIRVRKIEVLHPKDFMACLYIFRSDIYGCIQRSIKQGTRGEQQNLAIALLLGNRSHMSKVQKKNYIGSGLYHVLAVSGLHISILAFILSGILKKTLKGPWPLTILSVLLVIYNIIIGLRPSSLRASIMVMIALVASRARKEASRHLVMIIPFCTLLLVFPYYVKDIGFWLSFISIFSIFFIYPSINAIAEKLFKYKSILKSDFFRILLVTVSINIGIWPVISYGFGYIQLVSFISNPLILLAFPLLMFMLFCGGWVSLFSPMAGSVLFKASTPLLFFIDRSAKILSGLGFLVIELQVGPGVVIFYYLFIFMMFCFISQRLKNIKNQV